MTAHTTASATPIPLTLLGYRISNSLQLEADINHAKTPDFTGATTAMLKLVYRLRR